MKKIIIVLFLLISTPCFAEFTVKDKAYWDAKEEYGTTKEIMKLDVSDFTEEQGVAISESLNYDIRFKTEAEVKAQIYNSLDIYVIKIMEQKLAELEAAVAGLKATIAQTKLDVAAYKKEIE